MARTTYAIKARSLCLVLSSLACVQLWGAHAHAQTPEVPAEEAELERARALFYEGVELLDAEQWSQAEARLREVLDIRYSPVVAYNLAAALVPQGHYVEACHHLRRVRADLDADREVLGAAEQLLDHAEVELGRVTIRVEGSTEGLSLRLNGEPLALSALQAPVEVDPGEVEVVALRDGREVAWSKTTINRQTSLEAVLQLRISPAQLPGRAAAVDLRPRPPPPASAQPLRLADNRGVDSDEGIVAQWWFWTAAAVVVVGAGVTTGLLLSDSPDPPSTAIARGNFDPPLIEGRVP